jgi:hypothetical protein
MQVNLAAHRTRAVFSCCAVKINVAEVSQLVPTTPANRLK